MKKNQALRRWVFLFVCFIASNNTAQHRTQNENPYLLGKNDEFLQKIQLQLTQNSKKHNQNYPEITLAFPDSGTLNAKINYLEKKSNNPIHLEGEILGNNAGTFSIEMKNNKLEGRIILLKSKKAYTYYSDNTENAFIKEVDINTLICVDLPNPPAHLKKKKSEKQGKNTGNLAISHLQSLPSAAGCLLLDFDGHTIAAGSGWNGGNPIIAAPSGMSDAEISEAWEIVAEDYRPFNLNVTTDEAVFNTYPQNKRRRCIITPTDAASPGGTGIALINNFSSFNDLPCWVFTLGAGTSGSIVGEVASHELGHTLGLKHDGQNQYAYYSGHADWAPIMGSSYYKNVTQWSKGEYTNATNHEDDLAIISGATNAVGYRADVQGNTFTTAQTINISGVQIQGVIEQTDDVDMFKFTTTGGNVTLNIQAAERHSNLLLKALLYDEKNVLIGTYNADPTNLSAPVTINTILSAGNYFLAVTDMGKGTPDTGYSTYASLGAYFISGSVATTQSTLNTVESIKNDQIKVYPNPTKDELTIDFGSFKGNYQVEIFNTLQQTLYKTTTTDKVLKISLADKSPGIYFVLIKNKSTGFIKTFSVIKE